MGKNFDLKQFITHSLATEQRLLQEYMIAADKIEDGDKLELRHHLRELAEGNAKRSAQLEGVLRELR